MDMSAFATKADVEEIVGRVVSEVVGNALQLISERFDKVEACLDKLEHRMDRLEQRMDGLEHRMDRLEDKMDSVAATTDHHTIDIRELQRKAA